MLCHDGQLAHNGLAFCCLYMYENARFEADGDLRFNNKQICIEP